MVSNKLSSINCTNGFTGSPFIYICLEPEVQIQVQMVRPKFGVNGSMNSFD